MANNVSVRDAAGSVKQFKTTETASVHVPHHNIDNLADLLAAVDGLEAALATLNSAIATAANQSTMIGHVDGIETLVTAGNALLTTLNAKEFATTAKQDALAVLVGEVAANPTANTLLDRLKVLNTSIATTLGGYVDGLEALLTTIRDNADGVEAALTTLNGKDFATQATLAAVLTKLTTSESAVLLSDVTGIGAGAHAMLTKQITHHLVAAKVVGTGAVTATIEIWGRLSGIDVLLGSIDLAGTTSDSDAFGFDTPWPEVWADVTAISGTGAAVTAALGV